MVKTKQKQALPNKALCACSVAQSRPTLCDPLGCSLPGCSVHGIFQTRLLEWVAIFFPRDRTYVSVSSALAGGFFTCRVTWETHISILKKLMVKTKQKQVL